MSCSGGGTEAAAAVLALERLLEGTKELASPATQECGHIESEAAAAAAVESVRNALVQAKEAKHRLEELSCGLTVLLNAERVQYTAAEMAGLKKKVKSVRASRMTAEERENIARELLSHEETCGREVLFAVLETNPWYDAVYDERMASSRKNTLFFVFRRYNYLLLSHRGDKAYNVESVSAESQGSDSGWLEGREMRWLLQQMVGGSNSRVLNAMLASIAASRGEELSGTAVVYMGETWKEMVGILARTDGNERLVTKRLLAVTLAQAANAVSDRDRRVKVDKKAARKAQMEKQPLPQDAEEVTALPLVPLHLRLKTAAREDLFPFCQAWSLLAAVERQLTSNRWDASPPGVLDKLPTVFKEAMQKILSLKSSVRPFVEDEIFITIRQETSRLQALVETSQLEMALFEGFGTELETWMQQTRERSLQEEIEEALSIRSELTFNMSRSEMVVPCHVICDTDEKLTALLEEIGPPLTAQKGSLIYLAEGGSRMYNLSTPQSDSDFVGVFLWDTSMVLSSISKKKESAENKGKQARIEHSCFEARMMADMLLKGNPNVMELLFAPAAHYCSKEFELLRQHRRKLISEYAMVQYDSWVKWHLARIASGNKAATAGKLFYHALHKLAGLQCLARGDDPIVVMEDAPAAIADGDICAAISCGTITRDIILRIRKGPLEGPLSVSALLEAISLRHAVVKAQIKARNWRYPEWGDQGLLSHWLLLMRLRSYQQSTGQPTSLLRWRGMNEK